MPGAGAINIAYSSGGSHNMHWFRDCAFIRNTGSVGTLVRMYTGAASAGAGSVAFFGSGPDVNIYNSVDLLRCHFANNFGGVSHHVENYANDVAAAAVSIAYLILQNGGTTNVASDTARLSVIARQCVCP